MNKLTNAKLGKFSLFTIETGRFKLDGGAMFGVVPKTLWSRQIPADDKNRIPMAMRCLLIKSEETGKIYLIDDGIGTKFNEKFNNIYGVDFEHSSLEDSLAHHGFESGDITDVIFTHLHFDHCGGTTYYDGDTIRHQFPNATYHVLESQWKTATDPNAREKASFLKDNIEPIGESGRLHLVDNEHTYEDGLTNYIINGHTNGQQLPVINADDKTLVFMADLAPTSAHVPVPWVMAYDMYPAETLKEKKEFLKLASENNWYLFMEHDAQNEVIQITAEDSRFKPVENLTLEDL